MSKYQHGIAIAYKRYKVPSSTDAPSKFENEILLKSSSNDLDVHIYHLFISITIMIPMFPLLRIAMLIVEESLGQRFLLNP